MNNYVIEYDATANKYRGSITVKDRSYSTCWYNTSNGALVATIDYLIGLIK